MRRCSHAPCARHEHARSCRDGRVCVLTWQVLLYTTPPLFLDDVLVSCRLEGTTAHLNVFVSALGSAAATDRAATAATAAPGASVLITLRDAEGAVVARVALSKW